MEARHSDNQSIGEHVFELLSPFVDGETSADETRHVERHVAVCTLCAGQLAFLRATARTLRQASPVYPSPDLFARIARATYEKPTFSQRVAAFLRPAPVRVALGGALAAGIVAAVVVPGRLNVVPTVPQNGGGLASVSPAPLPDVTTPSKITPATPHHGTQSLAAGSAKNSASRLAPAPIVAKKPASVFTLPSPSLVKKTAPNAERQVVAIAKPKPAYSVKNGGNSITPTPPRPVSTQTVITAAQLHISRKPVQMAMNSNLAASLRPDLSSRGGLTTRLARPDTKIEAGSSALAVAAPIAVKPDIKTSELVLNPTPKSSGAASETALVSTAATVTRRARYNLGGAGTNNKPEGGLILTSFDRNAAPSIQNGHLGIVQAPIGNSGSDGK